MTAERKKSSNSRVANDGKLAGLKRFNLVMGFLHLLQGVLMILLSNDTSYPIYTNFLGFNAQTFSLSPEPKLLFELRFGPAVAAFLLLSALAHLFLATIGNSDYIKNLKRGMNPVHARRTLGSGCHHLDLWYQRHDEPIRDHDGVPQSEHGKD